MHCANFVNNPETMFCDRREQSGANRHGPCDEKIGKGVTSQNVTVQPGFDLQCQAAVDQSRW